MGKVGREKRTLVRIEPDFKSGVGVRLKAGLGLLSSAGCAWKPSLFVLGGKRAFVFAFSNGDTKRPVGVRSRDIGKLRLRAHICQDMSLPVGEIGGHLKPTCHQQIISRDLRLTGVFGLAEPLRKMRDDDKQARNPKWDFPSLPTIT
ncbi:hypothetical protein BHE74_00008317 [Ensete ventricosum]|nr:hypothetical protein BHE74_00008317 [Ensete ventricosum]RZR88927.1 hypothetical protein BHM03_00016570 [Ensete ventricosum]